MLLITGILSNTLHSKSHKMDLHFSVVTLQKIRIKFSGAGLFLQLPARLH